MPEHVFPIPPSATVNVRRVTAEVFNVELGGLTDDDVKILVDFHARMGGRFHAFRFEYDGFSYPECRFESDRGPGLTTASGPHSRTIPICILRSS
jgi:hypothetical protein